jgi:hypothetical protein
MLIKLSAEIGETVVVGGLQDNVPGYLYGVQCGLSKPLELQCTVYRNTISEICDREQTSEIKNVSRPLPLPAFVLARNWAAPR